MKRSVLWLLLGVGLSIFLLPVPSSCAEDLASGALLHKKFKLLPGKKDDRYVVYIPFEVTEPGRIRVYIEPTGSAPGSGEFPTFWLVDARIFDKIDLSTWRKICNTIAESWVVEYSPVLRPAKEFGQWIRREILGKEDMPKWFHGSKKLSATTPLVYDVDSKELRVTEGRYLVVLRNGSSGEFHGNILISFPGNVWAVDPEIEATHERKPDLAVERISLDPDNRVVVTLANHGPGWLYKVRYNRDGERVIRLDLEVDGRKAASVPLAEVDPTHALSYKGSPVTYRTEIQLSEPARVTAVIDADNVVAEPTEQNNRKRETLTPRTSTIAAGEPGKRAKRSTDAGAGAAQPAAAEIPDLAVGDLFLDNRRRICLRVENRGGGISSDVYGVNPPVTVHLFLNGRSRAYVPLAVLDPTGALRQGGGSTVWTSDQVLREAADITVVLDEGNRLQESEEANNAVTRRLVP